MQKIVYSLLAIILLSFGVGAQENGDSLKIEAALCKSVEKREPVGQDTVFPSDVGRVYCWSLVTGATEPTSITHVWCYGEKELARVELEIKSGWFRTWSYKTILPNWTGSWRVEILDSEGNLLKKLDFSVLARKTE